MKKFENIVIASDLDGTYFGAKSCIVQRNVERVKYFCENGGHFTFATGRLPLFIKKPIPDPQKYINMPAVMGNGTCIYDYSENRAIEEHFLDSAVISRILSFIRDFDNTLGIRATFREGFVVNDIENPISRREYERLPDFMDKRIISFEEWHKLDLFKINIIGDDKAIDELYSQLKERFSGATGITRSASFLIELIPLGVTKAQGLKKLVGEYFDRKMTLICVGDYDNDIEMLKLADIAVCPSNANDNVKAICDKCLCSNEEGVIGDLIDMLDRELR